MDRTAWHRARARRSRSGCLDMTHRHPDLECPYCDRSSDALLDAVDRQYARTAAEDLAGFGWSS